MPTRRTSLTVLIARLKAFEKQYPKQSSYPEGMHPKEIRLRIRLSGVTLTGLAERLRRSVRYLHQVINRERRSDYVESAIARLLAWQGFSRGDIWGTSRGGEAPSTKPSMPDTEEEP